MDALSDGGGRPETTGKIARRLLPSAGIRYLTAYTDRQDAGFARADARQRSTRVLTNSMSSSGSA